MNSDESFDPLAIRIVNSFSELPNHPSSYLEHESPALESEAQIPIPSSNYECSVCGKTFKFQIGLNKHMKKHHKVESESPKIQTDMQNGYKFDVEEALDFDPLAIIDVDKEKFDDNNGQSEINTQWKTFHLLNEKEQKILNDKSKSRKGSRNVLHKINKPKKYDKKFHKQEKLYSTNNHTYGSETHYTIFKCAQCNASFYEESKIEEHVILSGHNSSGSGASKISGYSCSDCEVSFSTVSSLKKHFSSEHQEKTVHSCALCRTPYLMMGELKEHYKVQHGID